MIPGFPDAQPVAGLIGGLMIGVAAAIMLLGLGRIAGVSGLAARAVGFTQGGAPRSVAIAFILGLPLGALVAMNDILEPLCERPSMWNRLNILTLFLASSGN